MLGTTTGIMGELPGELALPDVLQPGRPVYPAVTQGLVDITTVQTTLAKLLANTRGAIAGIGTVGNETLKITGFTEQPFFGKPVERRLDQLIRCAALTQLARQLDTTVLAACEQVHGCPPDGDGGVEYDGHRANQ